MMNMISSNMCTFVIKWVTLMLKCPISKPLFKKMFVIMSVLVLKLKTLTKKLIVRDKITPVRK